MPPKEDDDEEDWMFKTFNPKKKAAKTNIEKIIEDDDNPFTESGRLTLDDDFTCYIDHLDSLIEKNI